MLRFGESEGVLTGRGGAAPGVGRRWPSGRSRDAEPAAGEDPSSAAQRVCPRDGARPPLRVWGLPPPSRPGSARRAQCNGRPPCPGPGAERAARFPPRSAVRLAATCPRRCHARFCFLEALHRTYTAFISFSSSRPDSLRGSPVRRTLEFTPLTSLLPSATTPAPEVKRIIPSARLERGPEVPNFSPIRGR